MISSVKTVITLTELLRGEDEEPIEHPITINVDYFAAAKYKKYQKFATVLVGKGDQFRDTSEVTLGTGQKIVVTESAEEITKIIHEAQKKYRNQSF